MFEQGYPTEVALRFDSDGTCYALVRRDRRGDDPSSAMLGISPPGYKQWQWKDLGSEFNGFGGPNFIQIPGGHWLATGRMHDGGAHTAICYLDVENGAMTKLAKLPSGGDTSYPGMVWHNNILYISYYSSHEGKTSIYLAKVKVAPKPAVEISGIETPEMAISEDKSVTLQTVRAQVARNEALLDPVKMAYTVKLSRTGEQPQPPSGSRIRGRRYSHFNCIWAQSGERHYTRESSFYGPNEPANSTVKVIEPERIIDGKLPDLMEGSISPRSRQDWNSLKVAKLGFRPLGGHYKLSQVLVPEYASLHRKTEIIDGRETYVIDVGIPLVYPHFVRIWIDRRRAMPLRIRHFRRHPNRADAERIAEIDDIRLHELPNGGWIPCEGVRRLDRRDGSASYEHITVDISSITTRREDIPESLFKIDFPEGAGIYNVISGLTTIRGRPLKTYEQIVNTGGAFIAGKVVNEDDSPVTGIVVAPMLVRAKQSDGRYRLKLIQVYDRPCAITDSKGRFAIELDEEGEYELRVFPDDFVDMRVRNVPLHKHDLKIILRRGGTVTGRVVRLMKGRKVPVANVEVTAEEADRRSRTTFRRHQMKTITDSEGRFQIKHLDMLMPTRETRDSASPQYVPLVWQIRCGSTSQTVLFEDGKNSQEVELLLKPDLEEAIPLIGRVLPDFDDIRINLDAGQTRDRMTLICFFDMNQRPSRNYILQLAGQAEALRQRGISPAAVQTVKVDEDTLDTLSNWVAENNIPFPVGVIQDNEECICFDWAVCSLPWLILTDRDHIVNAEGFGIDELDQRINEATFKNDI